VGRSLVSGWRRGACLVWEMEVQRRRLASMGEEEEQAGWERRGIKRFIFLMYKEIVRSVLINKKTLFLHGIRA
jgi:hypothetical protein